MKIFWRIFLCMIAVMFTSCGKEEIFIPDNINSGNNDNVELRGAVDLGLSVKWAASDLGANLPYNLGTTCDMYEIIHAYQGYNISGTNRDPVVPIKGAPWRLPTVQEAEELISECDWKFGKLHDVSGWFVTGPSGKTIFLANETRWTGTYYSYNHIYTLDCNNTSPVIKTSDVYYTEYYIRPVCE